jgi:RNA polymerase sigma factor (sigma-70 family)
MTVLRRCSDLDDTVFVKQLLRMLPDRMAVMLAMHYAAGITFKQLAEDHGISDARVQQICKKGIEKIHEQVPFGKR